ncbi:hypothetical protein D3C83_238760 [compost metagenome]
MGPERCAIREVFLEIKEAVERILTSTTLEAMAERQREVLEQNISIPHSLPLVSLLPILPG